MAIYKHGGGVVPGTCHETTLLVIRAGLERWTSRFQVQHHYHSAVIPPLPRLAHLSLVDFFITSNGVNLALNCKPLHTDSLIIIIVIVVIIIIIIIINIIITDSSLGPKKNKTFSLLYRHLKTFTPVPLVFKLNKFNCMQFKIISVNVLNPGVTL